MASSHDSRWSDRRNMRQEDHRHEYGGKPRQQQQQHYDHYDPYDSTGENEYGSREYPDNYEQPNDLYENVPATRNIARIQITSDEEERRPQQRFRDYDQHTIDRPYKGEGARRDERRMESQRRTEMERNADKSRQQAENRRREEVEKARRADLEREEEKKRVEAERQRMAEERKRQEAQRKQQQNAQQARREPHLRYEPSPVPYQSHKQGIIDGFQSSPNKQKANDYREEDYRPQAKKNEIPPAPPAPKSIKAIINNLKGNGNSPDAKAYAKDDGRNDIPRNKVSTNPFIRAGEKPPSSPTRTPDQPIKNVQEVVQKMNSGEWPIRVEDDEQRMKNLQMRDLSRPRSQQSFDHPNKNQKSRQWEEIDHHPDRRNDVQRRPNSVRDLIREADEEQRRHESEFSERSDGAEVTTVSTDSAMGSDENSGNYPIDKLSLPFELPHGTVIRKLPGNVKELNEEAEKLLIYFKSHRSVLNYLGIGLSETLWTHIHALPDANAEIVVEITRNIPIHHSPKKAPPQITVTQPTFSPKHREQQRSPDRRGNQQQQAAQRPAQSPRMTALERQLCTDAVSPPPPSIDESLPPKDSARSGRFVKKSAAALIARKQGAVLQSDDEPLSSDFVDNRIAAEIEQLKAREEELRKSRSQLGLPMIEDVMDGGGLPYFDYQRQMPISRSQSAHAIYHDSRPSPSMNYFPNQREEFDENVTARVQRMREFEQKFERGEQFFRASENQLQLRQRSAISRVDITLSPNRASSPSSRSRKIGL